jgi:aspergillopepsin I
MFWTCKGVLIELGPVTPQQQTTFFDTAVSEGVLASPVFTADLKKGGPGSYDFGFIDSSKYTGDITYTSVNTANGFWEFTGTGYGVGSGSFTSSSIDGIADTGTTLLLLDDDIVSAYYDQVDGAGYDNSQGGYTFDCSADLPDFIVGIEEAKLTVPGSYMNYSPVSDGSSSKLSLVVCCPCPCRPR